MGGGEIEKKEKVGMGDVNGRIREEERKDERYVSLSYCSKR